MNHALILVFLVVENWHHGGCESQDYDANPTIRVEEDNRLLHRGSQGFKIFYHDRSVSANMGWWGNQEVHWKKLHCGGSSQI